MRYVIGIDGGTESLRAHVFDMTGRSIGDAVSGYPTDFPAPGRAEQDPRDWWRAIGEAVRGAVRAAGIRAHEIAGLALDTTSATVVLADEAGDPLRPAMPTVRSRHFQGCVSGDSRGYLSPGTNKRPASCWRP